MGETNSGTKVHLN